MGPQRLWAQDRLAARLLIVLTLTHAVLPRLVQSLTAPKHKVLLGAEAVGRSPLAEAGEKATFALLVLFCLAVLLTRLERIRTDAAPALLLLLAPWAYLLLRDLALGHSPARAAWLYPLVLGCVWLLRPRLHDLVLLGQLGGVLALLSIGLGVFLPAVGVYHAADGEALEPAKQLLPWGVLVGPLANSNNLGQLITLTLPSVLLARGRARVVAAVLVVPAVLFALVWIASRSSLAAAAVTLLVGALLALLPRHWRAVLAVPAVLAVLAVVVLLPLTTRELGAYSNRGLIWSESLRYWRTSPLLGLGSDFYASIGRFVNPLGRTAFHGHNQFVQFLVTGGAVLVVLVAIAGAVLVRRAVRWSCEGVNQPVLQILALGVSCSLEFSVGFVDRSFLLGVVGLPLAWALFARPLPVPVPRPVPAAAVAVHPRRVRHG